MPLASQNPAVYGAVSSGASMRPEPGRRMETGRETVKRMLRGVLLRAVFAAYPTDQYSLLFSIAPCMISSVLNKKLTGLGDHLSLLYLCSSRTERRQSYNPAAPVDSGPKDFEELQRNWSENDGSDDEK